MSDHPREISPVSGPPRSHDEDESGYQTCTILSDDVSGMLETDKVVLKSILKLRSSPNHSEEEKQQTGETTENDVENLRPERSVVFVEPISVSEVESPRRSGVQCLCSCDRGTVITLFVVFTVLLVVLYFALWQYILHYHGDLKKSQIVIVLVCSLIVVSAVEVPFAVYMMVTCLRRESNVIWNGGLRA